jgi:type II restriction/modification system DNA methylase subunit YeeA
MPVIKNSTLSRLSDKNSMPRISVEDTKQSKKEKSAQVNSNLNIASRVKELSLIKEGWYYGNGKGLDKDGLDWFYHEFEQSFDKALPCPCLFPTLHGELMAEWAIKEYDISLTVDLNGKTGYYHELNHANDKEYETYIKLFDIKGWKKLNQRLQKVIMNPYLCKKIIYHLTAMLPLFFLV